MRRKCALITSLVSSLLEVLLGKGSLVGQLPPVHVGMNAMGGVPLTVENDDGALQIQPIDLNDRDVPRFQPRCNRCPALQLLLMRPHSLWMTLV